MNKTGVLIVDPGLWSHIPENENGISASLFPFWGHYTFIDFHITNFISSEEYFLHFLFDTSTIFPAQKLLEMVPKERCRVHLLTNGYSGLVNLIEQMEYSTLIILSASALISFHPCFIQNIISPGGSEIHKVSIENIPLDFYITHKNRLLTLLSTYEGDNREHISEIVFFLQQVLQHNFDRLVEIPGKLLYHNSLFQLYENNMWLLKNLFSEEFLRLTFNWNTVNARRFDDTYIGHSGNVKNSFIGAGAEIHGEVENSIIFSGVVIQEGTLIKDSVIMNGNKIQSNCHFEKVLLLPFFDEVSKKHYNIKTGVSAGKNRDEICQTPLPEYTIKGVTVLGIDTCLEKDTIVETGSYRGPDIKKIEK